MKLKIKDGVIINTEDNTIVGTVSANISTEAERAIECGSEVLPAVEDFVDRVNSGTLKPRAAVREFEQILAKHAV